LTGDHRLGPYVDKSVFADRAEQLVVLPPRGAGYVDPQFAKRWRLWQGHDQRVSTYCRRSWSRGPSDLVVLRGSWLVVDVPRRDDALLGARVGSRPGVYRLTRRSRSRQPIGTSRSRLSGITSADGLVYEPVESRAKRELGREDGDLVAEVRPAVAPGAGLSHDAQPLRMRRSTRTLAPQISSPRWLRIERLEADAGLDVLAVAHPFGFHGLGLSRATRELDRGATELPACGRGRRG